MGRNLRSLKRRHGTTRADLYTARLSFYLSLSHYLFFSLARYRITRLDLWEYFGVWNIQPMSFRDVEAKDCLAFVYMDRHTCLRRELQ